MLIGAALAMSLLLLPPSSFFFIFVMVSLCVRVCLQTLIKRVAVSDCACLFKIPPASNTYLSLVSVGLYLIFRLVC